MAVNMTSTHYDEKGLAQALGRRLGRVRERRGLTQERLGALVGVRRTMVGRWERGEAKPGHLRLVRLAAALGVTTDLLLTGEHSRVVDQEVAKKVGELLEAGGREPLLRMLDVLLPLVAARRSAEEVKRDVTP